MYRIETKPREFMGETSGHLARTSCLGFESNEKLLEFLKGKRVLDLGSGAGHFAKQAYAILGEQAFIISMNPRLADAFYINQHKKFDAEININNYDFGIKRYNETAIAASWYHLPFKQESFDCIFATGSFLFYRNTYHNSVLSSLINLVKKNKGEIRIELSDESPELESAIKLAKSMQCKAERKKNIDGYYLKIKRGKL
jgi:SAM-dependent methyltransferase